MRTTWTAACAAALTLACAGSAAAAEYTPTTFEDSTSGFSPADCPPDAVETDPLEDCSVREALAAARNRAGDDSVKLAAGRYVLQGTLAFDGEGKITLTGAGARATTIDADADGNDPNRAVVIRPGTTGELTDLAITGAYMTGDGLLDGAALLVELGEEGPGNGIVRRVHIHGNTSAGSGGAIANQGKLTVDSSLIEGNTAQSTGGAIESWGQSTIVNTTLTGNKTVADFDPEGATGGAIHTSPISPEPSLSVESSTITDNTAAAQGGGIATSDDVLTTVRNSIVSGNHAADFDGDDHPNCLGDLKSSGHNIEDGTSCSFGAAGDVTADPKLGPLADNGGPTNTHALLTGSPAINTGVTSDCPPADQRRFVRDVGQCDIGAFELGAKTPHTDPPPPAPEEPKDDPKQPGNDGDKPVDPKPPVNDPKQPPANCRDKDKPFTTLKKSGVKVTAKGVTLRGKSVDAKGVCPSGVEAVQVSLAQVKGTDLNCRFLAKPNRFVLTPFRNCRKPVLFRATGTSKWAFTFKVKLAPGKYRAQARGFDGARNKETPTKRRNIIYFTVR